ANMEVHDVDHRDIEELVNGMVVEEQRVAGRVAGSKQLNRHLNAILKACHASSDPDTQFDGAHNPPLRQAVRAAQAALIPANYIERVIQLARQGYTSLQIDEYNTDWDSAAYRTVSGQNSNNSVRID